jgi:hypothetical protein
LGKIYKSAQTSIERNLSLAFVLSIRPGQIPAAAADAGQSPPGGFHFCFNFNL